MISNRRTYEIDDSKINRLWYPEIKRLLAKTNQATSRNLSMKVTVSWIPKLPASYHYIR